jgi:hypothetical protein
MWDRVAREFQAGLPAGIESARRLERLVGNLRRRLEVAFIDDDPSEANDARQILARVSREADLALGLPRSVKKRRRYKLMFFLEECVQAGLTAWPDFDALSATGALDGGVPDPDVAFIPVESPDGEPGWHQLVDLDALRTSLAKLDDLSMVPTVKLNALVASWRDRRAGAKKLVGSGSKVGAYQALHAVLKIAWRDATNPTQLKREWSAAKRPR